MDEFLFSLLNLLVLIDKLFDKLIILLFIISKLQEIYFENIGFLFYYNN